MKKVVLITGTSSGLGLETAVLLAQHDFKVYASMRNLAKQQKLLDAATAAGVEVQVVQLDVTDSDSINTCVNQIIEKEGRIDVLVNNAGAGFAKTTEQISESEMHWVMDVNFFGTVRCVKAVLPQMREQGSGRIINVSSVGGLVGQPFNELYCAAKFAVEGYTESMATYLTDAFGIHFTVVEPGGIVSEFMNSAMAKTITDGVMTLPPYQPILDKYLAGMRERAAAGQDQTYQTSAEVAQILLDVASAASPPVRLRTSAWAENFTRFKTSGDPDGTLQVEALKASFLS